MKKVKLIQNVPHYGKTGEVIVVANHHVNYLIKAHGAILIGDAPKPNPKKRSWTGYLRFRRNKPEELENEPILFWDNGVKMSKRYDATHCKKVRITEV